MSELLHEKEDLLHIGGSAYQEDGNCVFVFYEEDSAYGVERIILRNLLKLFGEDYVILSEKEYADERERLSMHVFTNLPWDMYKSILGKDHE